jgi:hypothetical protein
VNDQVTKWPETAFISFAEEFIYDIALGCKYGAAVATGSIKIIWEFIPIINLSAFRGEARHRLSEIIFLASRYAPNIMYGNTVVGEVGNADIRKAFWKILDSSEYERVVAVEGRLGLVRNPSVLLRKLRSAILDLTTRGEFKGVIKAGTSVAEFARLPLLGSGLGTLADTLKRKPGFAPPLFDLPLKTQYHIAISSLAESYPGSTPPKNTMFALEHARMGKVAHSWIEKGEKWKLKDNLRSTLKRLQTESIKTRRAVLQL